ncbi:MAG: TIGR00282 family metallophosphoesterase [Elusimicrobiota bacterium]|nr:TIGR00282 family metallophosphoesterase [Elusimicrobiota bacterium]
MKILFVGDIVGEPGRKILKELLPEIINTESIDFIIANCENAAGGKGLTGDISEEIFSTGVNVITLGNHTFARKEIDQIIDHPQILIPANYPPDVPGNRFGMYDVGNSKIAVVNLMGRVYMPLLDCPFRKLDEILEHLSRPEFRSDATNTTIIVDFHAEITSEKVAFGWYADGKVQAVVGTHTHVQTADERILPQGTAYITDCGMTGSREGIIGMDREIILKRYLTAMPYRFVVAKGETILNGCIIEIDEKNQKAVSIKRISRGYAR